MRVAPRVLHEDLADKKASWTADQTLLRPLAGFLESLHPHRPLQGDARHRLARIVVARIRLSYGLDQTLLRPLAGCLESLHRHRW